MIDALIFFLGRWRVKFSSEDVWLSKYPLFSTEYGKALHVGKISMQGFPAANALHGKFSDVQGFPDI